jgi:hypothetical protein
MINTIEMVILIFVARFLTDILILRINSNRSSGIEAGVPYL